MKIIRVIFALVIFSLSINTSYCFDLFKKSPSKPKAKMVETKQEWEIEAQNIPLEERELKVPEIPKSTKKYHIPPPHYVFEKYNYPQGTRKLNIEDIKKKTFSYPYVVADLECRYIAYPQYYYSPETNQISSNFYVEKLDTSKTKTRRILEYNHKQKHRIPIIQSGIMDNYPNLFKGLTLIDWSHDGKKLLIKESIGSMYKGIYKTYLHVHFMGDEIEDAATIKLVDFDEAIKNYFIDWENTQIVKYRYDIEPLGFSAENDNIIIALCYAIDKDNNKVFLGTWGYNCARGETILISKTNPVQNLSINGLILKQTVD